MWDGIIKKNVGIATLVRLFPIVCITYCYQNKKPRGVGIATPTPNACRRVPQAVPQWKNENEAGRGAYFKGGEPLL